MPMVAAKTVVRISTTHSSTLRDMTTHEVQRILRSQSILIAVTTFIRSSVGLPVEYWPLDSDELKEDERAVDVNVDHEH